MAVTFVKYQNTVLITITAPYIPISEPVYDENGNLIQDAVGTQTEVLDPPLASRLFAESHMPKVGDTIVFDAPPTPDLYVTSIRVQGRDTPKATTIPPVQGAPVTYVFAVANGPSSWTVSAVGQDDSVTIERGDT
jgi:hypothetical protein